MPTKGHTAGGLTSVFPPERKPLAPINQLATLPAAHVQTAGRTYLACTICEGAKVLPVISIAGERVKDVDCPHCGGVGYVG